jgi:hypothetical protein
VIVVAMGELESTHDKGTNSVQNWGRSPGKAKGFLLVEIRIAIQGVDSH